MTKKLVYRLQTVENFMSNQEYLDSLNNLMADLYEAPETETITLHRSAEETRRNQNSGNKIKRSKIGQKQTVETSSRYDTIYLFYFFLCCFYYLPQSHESLFLP